MLKNKKILIFIFTLLLIGGYLIIPEKEEAEELVDNFSLDSIPSVITEDVITLISDSGIYKYKVIAKTRFIYDNIAEPYWLFPDSVHLEQYDSLFNVTATIRADSVWNYTKQRLWKLRGNVEVQNIKNEEFYSEELFWDERKAIFHSQEEVYINIPDQYKIIATKGFEANQNFTQFSFTGNRRWEMYLKENKRENETNDEDFDEI